MTPQLLLNIRKEVINLLFNRYVFRTHQEFVRFNPRLQDRPRNIFSRWARVVYVGATVAGVRRLASASYQDGDVSLVKLLDTLIHEPRQLWDSFARHYAADAAKARDGVLKEAGQLLVGWEISACKRLLCEDRKMAINVTEKVNWFASKRVAHSVPDKVVSTTFSDLDTAIDVLKLLTEKYTLLAQVEKLDLLEEMKSRGLPNGWDSIFLEPWATPEIIARPLGEMPPPKRAASGGPRGPAVSRQSG